MNKITGLDEAQPEVGALKKDLESMIECVEAMQMIIKDMLEPCENPTEVPASVQFQRTN